MVNPLVARVKAPVIIVVLGSVKCRWPSARFALVEAATRHCTDGPLTEDVGLDPVGVAPFAPLEFLSGGLGEPR